MSSVCQRFVRLERPAPRTSAIADPSELMRSDPSAVTRPTRFRETYSRVRRSILRLR